MEKEAEDQTLDFSGHNPQSPSITPIVDVWEHNFVSEIKRLSELLEQYPYISFVRFSF